MSRGIWFLLIGMLVPQKCFALRKPDPAKSGTDKELLEQVDGQLRVAQDRQNRVLAKRKQLRAASDAYLYARTRVEEARYQQQADALDKEIQALTLDRDRAWTKAAYLTVRLYDLEPPRRNAPSVMGGNYKGLEAVWVLQAGEPERRKLHDRRGNEFWEDPPSGRSYGVTYFDGTTALFPAAFSNARTLASTIYHERIHFEQFITNGNRLDRYEREYFAYDAELKQAHVFGLTEAELKSIRWRRDFAAKKEDIPIPPEEWTRERSHYGKKDLGDDVYRLPHTEGELAAIRREAESLERAVGQELDERRRQRQAEEDRRVQVESDRAGWWRILRFSAQACGFELETRWETGRLPDRLAVVRRGETPYLDKRFEFDRPPTVLIAEAAFALVRACYGGEPVAPGCSAIGELKEQDWADKSFWSWVQPSNKDWADLNCLMDLQRSKKPRDYEDLLKTIRSNEKRRQESEERAHGRGARREREPSGSDERRDPPEPPERPRCRYQGDWCR